MGRRVDNPASDARHPSWCATHEETKYPGDGGWFCASCRLEDRGRVRRERMIAHALRMAPPKKDG